MPYRDPTCAFCSASSEGACGRCESLVCATHLSPRAPWCARCEEERVFEVDLAEAEATLFNPEPQADTWLVRADLVNLIQLLVTVASRPFRRSRARKDAEREFHARTPPAIEAWRVAHRRV